VSKRGTMRLTLATVLLLSALPARAIAAGSLTISLQDDRARPVEGTASVTPLGGGGSRSCITRAGTCTVSSLAAGPYRVAATTLRGGSAPAVTVSVVEGRSVRARLTAPAGPAPTAPMQSSGGAQQQVIPMAQPGSTRPGAPGVTVHPGPAVSNPGVQGTLHAGAPLPTSRGPLPVLLHDTPHGTTMVTTSAQTAPHNLGSGNHWVIRGQAQDQRSRPVEGNVTVSQGSTVLGTVSTTGGAFQVYDLAPGTYHLSFTCLSGQRTSASVAVGGGTAVSVRLIVQR
jgi:hypothetical protein